MNLDTNITTARVTAASGLERTMLGRTITVDHSSRYLCRHESVAGVGSHHAYAKSRYRVGPRGERWPLCQEHADQWRQMGLIASRPGPQESHRRDRPA